jgi:hypothetical protein
MIGGLCGYLAVGKVPAPITDVHGAGQKKPGPTERRDIRIAATYVNAAKAGKITDATPIKTITKAFGVGQRTAEGWARDSTDLPVETPGILPSLVERAGRRYQQAGRSHSAITERAKPMAKKRKTPQIIGKSIGLSFKAYLATIKYDEMSRNERIADIKDAMGKLGR